jgi:sterol 3beta-glucosyltransferase
VANTRCDPCWLFPQIAAVVHHRGAGRTAAGLRAGVPSVVTPLMGDQPFWGRVFDLGVGPRPVSRSRLTVDSLTESISRSVSDRGMRDRAASLGERIRAENGIANAVAVIEASRG